jgi:hypothetical protein
MSYLNLPPPSFSFISSLPIPEVHSLYFLSMLKTGTVIFLEGNSVQREFKSPVFYVIFFAFVLGIMKWTPCFY